MGYRWGNNGALACGFVFSLAASLATSVARAQTAPGGVAGVNLSGVTTGSLDFTKTQAALGNLSTAFSGLSGGSMDACVKAKESPLMTALKSQYSGKEGVSAITGFLNGKVSTGGAGATFGAGSNPDQCGDTALPEDCGAFSDNGAVKLPALNAFLKGKQGVFACQKQGYLGQLGQLDIAQATLSCAQQAGQQIRDAITNQLAPALAALHQQAETAVGKLEAIDEDLAAKDAQAKEQLLGNDETKTPGLKQLADSANPASPQGEIDAFKTSIQGFQNFVQALRDGRQKTSTILAKMEISRTNDCMRTANNSPSTMTCAETGSAPQSPEAWVACRVRQYGRTQGGRVCRPGESCWTKVEAAAARVSSKLGGVLDNMPKAMAKWPSPSSAEEFKAAWSAPGYSTPEQARAAMVSALTAAADSEVARMWGNSDGVSLVDRMMQQWDRCYAKSQAAVLDETAADRKAFEDKVAEGEQTQKDAMDTAVGKMKALYAKVSTALQLHNTEIGTTCERNLTGGDATSRMQALYEYVGDKNTAGCLSNVATLVKSRLDAPAILKIKGTGSNGLPTGSCAASGSMDCLSCFGVEGCALKLENYEKTLRQTTIPGMKRYAVEYKRYLNQSLEKMVAQTAAGLKTVSAGLMAQLAQVSGQLKGLGVSAGNLSKLLGTEAFKDDAKGLHDPSQGDLLKIVAGQGLQIPEMLTDGEEVTKTVAATNTRMEEIRDKLTKVAEGESKISKIVASCSKDTKDSMAKKTERLQSLSVECNTYTKFCEEQTAKPQLFGDAAQIVAKFGIGADFSGGGALGTGISSCDDTKARGKERQNRVIAMNGRCAADPYSPSCTAEKNAIGVDFADIHTGATKPECKSMSALVKEIEVGGAALDKLGKTAGSALGD